MGFLCTKAKFLKMMLSIRGINRASRAKKNGVKDDFLAFKRLQIISRRFLPEDFTVLNFCDVHFALANIKLVSSASISTGLSWA